MLLTACGTDTSTATAVPAAADTATPALAATATTAPAVAATDTVAPATAATATTAPAVATTATGAAPAGKIAILLPETKTARYETQDLPNFKAKLKPSALMSTQPDLLQRQPGRQRPAARRPRPP